MTETIAPKPYRVQPALSDAAKKALWREKGSRLQKGENVTIADIASEWIEERAKLVP